MSDPISTIGLGIGALSFILQVTDDCIKRYKYFTEAIHMSESYQYLRVRVQVEQQRFLSFVMEAGLLYDDGKICAALQVNHVILKDVLIEINSLFQRYEKKNGKYINIVGPSNIPWDDTGEPQTNIMELLCCPPESTVRGNHSAGEKQSFSISRSLRKMGDRTATAARKLRTIVTEPRRLVWVNIDQEEFEALVSKLTDLNSFLMGLLKVSHERKLEKAVDMNYLELLQLRDDVESLRTLIRALDQGPKDYDKTDGLSIPHSCARLDFEAARIERRADEDRKQYLINLARLKIRHIETSQPQNMGSSPILRMCTRTSLDFSLFNISIDIPGKKEHERRTIASWNNRGVWLEWIEHSSGSFSNEHADETLSEERVVLLTRLLCGEIPASFRTPECLGYVKLPNRNNQFDYGIVFEKPSRPDMESTLITLRELLFARPRPSFTARISLCCALADCLFNFHSVDWLHKGIRSDNILFFTQNEEPNLSMPYITGYGLSRPCEVPEMTEKPLIDPSSDMYRHPDAQFGEAKQFFKKSYDIYSFGIILLEVAFWKPIEAVLGVDDIQRMGPRELRSIRAQLLGLQANNGELQSSTGSHILAEVANQCGDSYRDIIQICLEANEVETPMYTGESGASTKHRLQTMFREQVIDKLRLMKEALSSSR